MCGRRGRRTSEGRCAGALLASRRALAAEEGQASVEAALLLPSLMVCMALLAQPACLLYTRTVMQAAAAEGCRLMATAPEEASVAASSQRDYVLRRLAAVPDVDIFHVGGDQGWTIEMEGSTAEHTARVRIATAARPLPLLGVLPGLLGKTDGSGNVVLETEVETTTRPAWLEGGYGDWSSLWES